MMVLWYHKHGVYSRFREEKRKKKIDTDRALYFIIVHEPGKKDFRRLRGLWKTKETFVMEILKEARVRTEEDKKKLTQTVGEMIDNVRERKDQALREYSQCFDGSVRESFRIRPEEIQEAYAQLTEEEIQDLKTAAEHIRAFAKAQRETIQPLENFSPAPGIFLGHRIIPVNSCCCYVPGGNYPLYSTALMLVIPAKTAGVGRVAACSPVMKGTGKIHPKTLAAMDIAGADEIYALGGAQAVAACSYGTAEICTVDMIGGPGNQYVTEAKRNCY